MARESTAAFLKQMKFKMVEHLMNNPQLLESKSVKSVKKALWENELISQHFVTPLFGKIGESETKKRFSALAESAVEEVGGMKKQIVAEDEEHGLPVKVVVHADSEEDAVDAASDEVGYAIMSCRVHYFGGDTWSVEDIVWDLSDEEDESGFVAPPVYTR